MPNATHHPSLKSWVESANTPDSHFPIQNLPFGVFSVNGGERHIAIAIGDFVLDLTILEKLGKIRTGKAPVFQSETLNTFMACDPADWAHLRQEVSELLSETTTDLRDDAALRAQVLTPHSDVEMHLPFFVRSYTDFYASREHATNVGTMFRGKENALPPNWLHIPIGYNGRASSVVVTGTDIRRPQGQLKAPDADQPVFGPSRKLDIELELGAIVGTPNEMGRPVTISEAQDMIFGFVILNDWSARDIQVWEYQPLGPFQSKVFASSISPWIVTREAMEPYRCHAPAREKELLAYLKESAPNNYSVHLNVDIQRGAGPRQTVSRTNAKGLYYSSAQQLAHHASGGCPMETGDLLGSGTISGAERGSEGSFLELTWNGTEPISLEGGEELRFLEDGDQVTLTGWCQGEGHRIGFGECSGKILPAPEMPSD